MNKKRIIILTLAICVMVAVGFFLRGKQHDREKIGDLSPITALPEDMEQIEIAYPDGEKLVVEKRDDKWELVEPTGLRYSQDLVDAIPLNLYYLDANKTVEESPSDLKVYGLDAPVTVTVRSASDKIETIAIGAQTSAEDGYYFMTGNTVCTMTSGKAQSLLLNRLTILDPYVLIIDRSLKLTDAAAKITGIECICRDQTIVSGTRNDAGEWNSDQTELCEKLAGALAQLRALEFVAQDNPAELGLDPAKLKITYQFKGDSETLLIGNEADSPNTLYAKLENWDQIFVIADAGFSTWEEETFAPSDEPASDTEAAETERTETDSVEFEQTDTLLSETKTEEIEQKDTEQAETGTESTPVSTDPAADQVAEVVTNYSDLWTGNITVKAGTTIRWYVDLPKDTDVYAGMGGRSDLGRVACEYSIKIPALGIGTDSFGYEDGQVNLGPGRTFICEFTPTEGQDIRFTCWMGSECHFNDIHVIAP